MSSPSPKSTPKSTPRSLPGAAKAAERAEANPRPPVALPGALAACAGERMAGLDLAAPRVPDTPAFKRWFGASKVVDDRGEPVVVFHGTDKVFHAFDLQKTAQGILWFTNDRRSIEAGESGAQGVKIILELYASIQNPAGWKEYDQFCVGELIGRGFDGVILPEKDGTFCGFAFEPNQLKSTTNQGTFDPITPDLRR